MINQTLSQLLTDRVTIFAESPRPAELIDAGIEKMFQSVVDDLFRSYGDFTKVVKEAMAAAMPANVGDVFELTKYNAMVASLLRQRWEQAAVESLVLKTADKAISEVLTGDGLITGEVSLRALLQDFIDDNKDDARQHGWESPEIRFEEEARYGHTYLAVYFDPEPESSYRSGSYARERRGDYSLKHRLHIRLTGDERAAANSWDSATRLGEVYHAGIDDKKIELAMSVRSGWERKLASLYFGNAVLLVDCDQDDFSYGLDD
ncbi:hypothetical protein [Pseudomonas denitrificans (nom. rej.)]|uniref:Uncharacterized protein n=1 Tax=Pseudomonas denitrificans TaxID=43306 RepID=A0A9X7N1E1_PSEDE|nr:hypothetical protein [Pseudomonas denitrificans (nom. rej.)]QEY73246.1 hypothetical protein F1C79_17470 [Pseudomonas denitrificans (nom. rej.)]